MASRFKEGLAGLAIAGCGLGLSGCLGVQIGATAAIVNEMVRRDSNQNVQDNGPLWKRTADSVYVNVQSSIDIGTGDLGALTVYTDPQGGIQFVNCNDNYVSIPWSQITWAALDEKSPKNDIVVWPVGRGEIIFNFPKEDNTRGLVAYIQSRISK